MNSNRPPLVRIAKRTNMPALHAWLIRIGGLLAALLVGSIFIIALGHNPITVYIEMVNAAFGSRIGFNETVRIAVPLLGASLAVGIAFKMRFWNIGAEGQILVGAIAATYFALFHANNMPRPVLLIVMGLAGAVAGGLWGLIPAFFRAKWGTNETLFTLMLNYIALRFISYLQAGPWQREGTAFPIIAMFDQNARLPRLFGIHIGWVIVIILTALVYLYLGKTKQGYQIGVVGESQNTARYAGMNVAQIIMRTMFISGAIAGLVGFIQVSGSDFTLNETTGGGIGFTAIIVAWVSHLNPLIMVVMATFIAILQRGSMRIQTTFMIPATIASVLTGIILFFMLACEFFINFRVIFRGKVEAQ